MELAEKRWTKEKNRRLLYKKNYIRHGHHIGLEFYCSSACPTLLISYTQPTYKLKLQSSSINIGSIVANCKNRENEVIMLKYYICKYSLVGCNSS